MYLDLTTYLTSAFWGTKYNIEKSLWNHESIVNLKVFEIQNLLSAGATDPCSYLNLERIHTVATYNFIK